MVMVPLFLRGKAVAHVAVDFRDYEWAMQYRWRLSATYAIRTVKIDGKWTTELMHSELMGLKKGDKREVDHKNGDHLDNTRSNLRVVTRTQNRHNLHSVWGKSKFRGVTILKSGRCRAQVTVNGVTHSLGYFATEEEAGKAAFDFRQVHMGNVK